ncbi:hypothetical protein JR316_0005928 [Psilocybe cubensis]|uniref:Uncharacterized protein n=1 Tax=Psilocybe cubensis TaxID=181762 RepID=A0ACB8H139_PSICU|nr:hypothetical protein JR316_0005928 [Psilocybe cubensis]KAH9481402.1 hypothetical protein JR316_0005928 [Psilocybe cubensis]
MQGKAEFCGDANKLETPARGVMDGDSISTGDSDRGVGAIAWVENISVSYIWDDFALAILDARFGGVHSSMVE